jgi:hypothetical protein
VPGTLFTSVLSLLSSLFVTISSKAVDSSGVINSSFDVDGLLLRETWFYYGQKTGVA